jgi:hypothetical protein
MYNSLYDAGKPEMVTVLAPELIFVVLSNVIPPPPEEPLTRSESVVIMVFQ